MLITLKQLPEFKATLYSEIELRNEIVAAAQVLMTLSSDTRMSSVVTADPGAIVMTLTREPAVVV